MKLINTVAFILCCYFVGGATAISLTCLIFDLDTSQLSDLLRHPQISNKPIVLTQALLFTVSSFLIFPTIYLALVRNNPITVLRGSKPLQLRLVLVTIVLVFSVLPILSILIDLNYKVSFPNWLSGIETFFKEMEAAARRSSDSLLIFHNIKDLLIALVIIALIPGFAEEYFFRGLVQSQLQNVFRNQHHAVLVSALLFSLMHFQFYGLVPRMALGVLFGYMFFWSKNIWYPAIAHMVNNSIGVFATFFWGPGVLDPGTSKHPPVILTFASIAVSVAMILYLKRNYKAALEPVSGSG